jgi:AcrR family transcriptional regulator
MAVHHTTTPKAHGTRLAPEVRRAQIVEAAATVFRGRDPAEVSFEEVAEAAGVSRSLVYTYFGDRGGLVAAVYLHDLERLDREVSRALDARLAPEVRLRRLIRRYLRFARDHRTTWDVITSAGALQHPAVQTARRQRTERIAEAWGGGRETRLVARAVLGLLEAGADEWAQHRDCGLEQACDLLFSVLWQGLEGRQPAGRTAGT